VLAAVGQQAVANAAMAAQKEIAMAKIAASILTGGAADGGTASEGGATINEGRSLDERDGAAGGGKAAPAGGSQEGKAADGVAGRVLGLSAEDRTAGGESGEGEAAGA
jgi:hypothetical protein